MSDRVDKDSLPLDKPRRTPNHPTKSHIVKTKVDGKERIIRFGEQGASTAGKPKAGESERMKMKRKSFKARHAKNIAKGKSSPAYWADKVKWKTGGHVELSQMLADYEDADDVRHLVQKFKSGGQVKKEPSLNDYLMSVANTITSLPDLPGALYQSGKRAVQSIPEVTARVARYINNTSPRKVARDVAGGATRVARQVKENPVSTIVDFIPVVGDIKAYGEDVSRATQMRAAGDERGARSIEQYALPLALASIAPGVGEARKAGKVAGAVEDVARPGTKTMKRAASFPVNYGRPEGNLNLRPNIDPVTLKGAEVQDVESLINQLKGKPGVTKQGLERVASEFFPGEKISLARFGERMPRSEYSLTDLASAVDDPYEHLWDEAHDIVNQERGELFYRMASNMGLDPDYTRVIRDIYDNGFRRDAQGHNTVMGALRLVDPDRDPEDTLIDLYRDTHSEAIDETVERLQEMAADVDYGDLGGYQYQDYQRLVPDIYKTDQGYFEVGLTHPEMTDKYRHYPNAENLAGHIRGTFMGSNPRNLLSGLRPLRSYDAPVTIEEFLGGRGSRDFNFTPKPNSVVIEELQSDAAKNLGDTGALHQIHGTLFKGAIQHALEQGAGAVYLPTSKAIGIARYTDPSVYAPIYDKEVIKYGLNPLREIPGVEVNPIEDMYHEIVISPEARERILKGAGQKAPGYAEGGLVSSYDEAKVKDLADQIREGIYG